MGGDKSEDYAITLSNIATIYYNRGSDTEALKYCEEALKVEEGLPGNKATRDSSLLSNLGTLYYSQKDYAKAITFF